MKLTAKQEKFCMEYCIDFNGTQAAIRAGYSKKTAQEIASENLSKPIIKDRISKLKKEIVRKYELTEEKIINELQQIAHADLGEYLNYYHLEKEKINKETGEIIRNKGLLKIELEDSRIVNTKAIAEIQNSDKGFKFKMHDKISALTKLGEYLGMWKTKTENTNVNTNKNVDMTYEEWIDSLSDEEIENLSEEEARKMYDEIRNKKEEK